MRPPHARPAFTLIELLVVVTIIVVLLALMAPALDKAIEAAGRAACASNLHHWGTAHGMYYIDNKRKLMTHARIFADSQNTQDGWVYPHHAWIWNDTPYPGQFSAQAYAPYGLMSYSQVPTRNTASAATPAGTQTTGDGSGGTGATISKMWLCPSDPRFKQLADRNTNEARKPPGPTKSTGDFARDHGGPIVDGHYAYFGRVSDWAMTGGGSVNTSGAGGIRAPWPHELVDNSLGGNQLLMNDHLKHDGSWNISSFSHGDPLEGVLSLQGVNQLYGDGGVVWMDDRYFDKQLLKEQPFDTGPGNDTTGAHYVATAASYNSGGGAYYFYATGTR